MANYFKVFNAAKMVVARTPGQKLMALLPKTAGARGSVTLSKTQLQLFAKHGSPEVKKVLQPVLQRLENPSLDIAYKAKSNYSIAGLRLRDGQEIVGQGAISVSKAGTKAPIIKARASVGTNGEIASMNGFVDAGKKTKFQNTDFNMSRRNQVVTSGVRADNALGINIRVNEPQTVQLAKKLKIDGAQNIVDRYNKGIQNGQTGLDNIMQGIKDFLA